MAATDLTTGAVDAAANAAAVAAANAAAQKAANATKSQAAANQLTSDFNFFLTMLTTQLKNQDPTQPMDVAQMTQQIAQFSGVQQQVATNANLEKMIAAQNKSTLGTAVSYIGKEVEMEGNTGTLQYAQDGTQTGTAQFNYRLPAGAATAKVSIKDKDGNVVYTGNGPIAEGKNTVKWNGVSNITNKQLDAGTYSISVEAKNASGEVLENVTVGDPAKLTYAATSIGQATFSYVLDKAADSASVTITDSTGAAVFQGQGTKLKGRNVVVWDGKNSFNGNIMPAGKYTMTVKAKDADGKDITLKSYAVGVVNTVETGKDGTIKLTVDDVVVNFDDIVAVRDPTPILTNS